MGGTCVKNIVHVKGILINLVNPAQILVGILSPAYPPTGPIKRWDGGRTSDTLGSKETAVTKGNNDKATFTNLSPCLVLESGSTNKKDVTWVKLYSQS